MIWFKESEKQVNVKANILVQSPTHNGRFNLLQRALGHHKKKLGFCFPHPFPPPSQLKLLME